ncbi:TPA: hypothetical protein ACH3X1_008206 [Trebouxia sp. C0004]
MVIVAVSGDNFGGSAIDFGGIASAIKVVYSNVSAQYYSAYASSNPSQYTLRVLYVLEQLGVDVPPQASQADDTTITWIGPTLLDLPASANQDSTPAVQAMASATQPARHCSNVAAYGIAGLTADSSTSRFSSVPEKGTEADLDRTQARTSLKPLGVDQVKLQTMNATSKLSAAIGNASSNSNGSRLSKKHCWQKPVKEQTRGASAGSTALQQKGKPFAGTVASVPELSRQMSQMSVGEVELGPLLGQGAYGRVFKGRWKGALIAVKVMDHTVKGNSSNAVDIQRETSLSVSLVHPNVVSTYKVVTVNTSRPTPDFSARRGSLQQGIKSGSTLTYHADTSATPEPAVMDDAMHTANAKDQKQTWMLLETDHGYRLQVNLYKSLQDIAAGMDYLHSLGVLHGDLKGANVLLKSTATDSRGFICKLADFGLSCVLDLDKTHVSTHTHGTISYMPPEVLSHGKMTRAADIYSFGMLMWEIYTGSSVFKGLTVGQVFFAVVYQAQRPAIPEDCPDAFVTLMTSCWSADPLQRPTFRQITKDLQLLRKASQVSPLYRITSAPAGAAYKVGGTNDPQPLQAPPLQLPACMTGVGDLKEPSAGQFDFTLSCEAYKLRYF